MLAKAAVVGIVLDRGEKKHYSAVQTDQKYWWCIRLCCYFQWLQFSIDALSPVNSDNVPRFTRDPSRRTWILKETGATAAINMPNITRLQGGTSLCIRSTSCLTHPRCTRMMDFTHASEYLNRIHNKTGFYGPTQKAPSAKLFKLAALQRWK